LDELLEAAEAMDSLGISLDDLADWGIDLGDVLGKAGGKGETDWQGNTRMPNNLEGAMAKFFGLNVKGKGKNKGKSTEKVAKSFARVLRDRERERIRFDDDGMESNLNVLTEEATEEEADDYVVTHLQDCDEKSIAEFKKIHPKLQKLVIAKGPIEDDAKNKSQRLMSRCRKAEQWVAKMGPGDWACPGCGGFRNKSDTKCNKCDIPAPSYS